MLLAFKILHPERVHLNRGNHKDVMLNEAYGFAQEVPCNCHLRDLHDGATGEDSVE